MSLPPALHMSLYVRDMERSKAFYRTLFGIEPAKVRADYAKFETAEPPLVLSLIPGRAESVGVVNHAGLRVSSSETLVKIQHRLEAAGLKTVREDGVECCYALQTKFWVTDPDRLLWEIYVFHEDIDEHGEGSVPQVEDIARPAAPERRTWSASLSEELPARIPFEGNWLHEVILEGVANRQPDLATFYREVMRVLRPGGAIRLHGLSADAPLANASPGLPGPASSVRHVPTHEAVAAAVAKAGFHRVRFDLLSERGYFEREGVQLREFRLEGFKPGHRPKSAAHAATYLGPLAEVTDDFGNRYPRGVRQVVNVHDWTNLKDGAMSAFFLLSPPEAKAEPAACCDGEDKMGT